MSINVTINGQSYEAQEGMTILQLAQAHQIEIPTLCYDERVKTYGACGLCVVEVEGSPKLFRACATVVADGMRILTDTQRVRDSRKTALEFLLSDHTGDCKAPCSIACPAGTDCQGYVGLIANGEFEQAIQVVKDKIPLPASIGRVCPHPCEEACRRQFVEDSVGIAQLKSFVADKDLNGNKYVPEMAPATGKSVAIVGGGPAGLSAAYFLAVKGHAVTIYDFMPQMGGMLRYGIPEYRLPKKVVDAEVDTIAQMGVMMKNNITIGKDVTLAQLRQDYDAVVVAIGAWTSRGMRVPGEDGNNVIGGIDFLRTVALGQPTPIGDKVAVVGGGNTAMDACRTAVRLGAKEVSVIYRRTRDEMPAEDVEIKEAEEEGVIFRFLTNPIEFNEGSVVLQKMKLGDPDASGRRSPVAIEGHTEELPVDTVIMAIGQGTNPAGFEELELTSRHTIAADESTYMTNLAGVFAIGDATNRGASIAIEAIGEAQRGAQVIDSYLKGAVVGYKKPYMVTLEQPPYEKLKTFGKMDRQVMNHLTPDDRKHNFEEIMLGYTDEQAIKEANRCLGCGCHDYFDCKLYRYANDYDVKPERLAGEKHNRTVADTHPYILRNPDKCILCGLCVRACDEVMHIGALGLVDRGFDTIVKPAIGQPLLDAGCVSCGLCVSLCPTGALLEMNRFKKDVPVAEERKLVKCTYCPTGCMIDLRTCGHTVTRALPAEGGLLCAMGRFGTVNQANGKIGGTFYIDHTDNFTPIDADIAARLVPGIPAEQVLKGLSIVSRKSK